jgi:hypothetical protein
MTAREQLAQAGERFRQADRAVYLLGIPGDVRLIYYRLWIEACERFRREG